ncbi:MAG: homoserine dehydrogenase [Oscillospiraceae bacterium]|nr:homoserine dehydrogenase [Oscillospiraceae bacterium]
MIQVAILGYGVVGAGVAELLTRPAGPLPAALPMEKPELAAVLDIREFPESPCAGLFVRDFQAIEQNPDIRVVAECIGGVRAAYDFTLRALRAGKHVVTSNKELVAEHGAELMALAARKRVNYLFEAAVGGGIPIIGPLSRDLAANRISEVCGILNGTTNYILTRMRESGLSMLEALDEAGEKGYAEADPTDDVEGKDACRKIAILASLAFGRHIYPNYVPTHGISYITRAQMEAAGKAGGAVKLIGRARVLPDGRVSVLVAPHVVDAGHPLHGVNGVNNAVLVRGDAVGDVLFCGRGAGREPTASAVMGDIYRCAAHPGGCGYTGWQDTGGDITAEWPEEPELFHFPDGTEMPRLTAE